MQMTLYRQGTFKAKLIDNAFKCGPLGLHEFAYEVTICMDQKRLGPSGFVMDTNRVDAYWQDLWTTRQHHAVSCETMAKMGTDYFVSETFGNAMWVRIRVSPLEGRWVECEWRAPKKRKEA